MKVVLGRSFFERPTLQVARELIGKVMVRRLPQGLRRFRIVEVEAYCGEQDLACHASKGRTQRTAVMFGPAGRLYVYLIYGMYYCLNIVTAEEGMGEAVLIRALEPLSGTSQNTRGPGRLCRALKIGRRLNHKSLGRAVGLWVADDGFRVKPSQIGRSTRRGVAYAGECAAYPWRFFLKRSRYVS
jgi:DNA-3-methyladenine glycosylase